MARGARGGAAKSEVDALKAQVASLKKANSKLKHKVARLETKLEAADLEGSDGEGAGASEGQAKLRGMLDRFRSLMEEATIGEEEECPICFDGLKVNEASSLPCEHVYCTSCLSSLSKTAITASSSSDDEDDGPKFPCPACRQLATVDDAAVVTLTETDRWNALLEISVEFARWGDEVDGEEEEDDEGEGEGAEFGKDESGESEAEEGEFRPAVAMAPAAGGGRRRNRSIESDEEEENDDDDEAEEAAAPNSPKKQKLMDLAKSRARGKR